MKKFRHQFGVSIVEVIIASAIFVILATPAVVVMLSGLNMNRLSLEQTVATQFASEGIEAVKSIKNQAYTNLLTPNPTPRGIVRNGSNVWAFLGDSTNNTLAHNASDNYVRTIKIDTVNRDATPPNGNIVASGGTTDPDTKKVSSTVTWNFSAVRPESVTLISYLSDWRKAISGGGILIYGDSTTTPKYRALDSAGSFGAESSTPVAISGLNFAIKTSPTKTEAVAAFSNSAGLMQVYCYDGSTWTAEWSVTVGGTGTTRRFDIGYEKTTGDVIVFYSTNSATTELAYRTKSGSSACGSANWSGASTYAAARTTGVVQWVKMSEDLRSGQNLIAAIWADANRDLSGAIWNGSTWVNEPTAVLESNLEVASAATDVETFDIEYESLSGDIMVVWGNAGTSTTNGAYYAVCPGGTSSCTWGTKTAIPAMANDATNLDISANSESDEIVFASIGNSGSDLQVNYWDGSTWSSNAANNDIDASAQTPTPGMKLLSTGWVVNGGTTRSVVVYADASATTTSISYYTGSGDVFSAQTDFVGTPVPGAFRYFDIQMNPVDSSKLLLLFSDTNSDLFAKQLTMSSTPTFSWSNTEGGSALETTLGQALRSPFGFAYFRNP